MRSAMQWCASTVVLALGGVATAVQDADPNGAQRQAFDDGVGESLWKVSSPSGPSDWFNVDFDGALSGLELVQVHCDSGELAGIPGSHLDLAVYEESTIFPSTPGIRIAGRLNPTVNASDAAGSDSAYVVDLKGPLAVADHHVALQFTPGDSHTWVAADTNSAVSGRSYFTANGYSTGAIPFSVNWMLAAGTFESTTPGTLLINGATTSAIEQDGGTVCLTFFGPAMNTVSALYLCLGGTPSLQLLPVPFTITDGTFAGPCPMTWQICAALDCNTPTASGVELCTIYFDQTDLRPNGKPKAKLGASAFLDIVASATCTSGGAGDCFGQRDDCILDSTIWKVTNPAGPSDWFAVNHGTTAGSSVPVNNLTGVSISSWDFCGFGPCWSEVGIYPVNTAVGSGCSPDIANPITTVSGTSACAPPGVGNWGCPLTFYDVPDVAANSTTQYFAAVHWNASDSCLWLGSDTDGTDSSCGTPIPNNGCVSLFSTDGFSTPAIPFTVANWMMQIDWN